MNAATLTQPLLMAGGTLLGAIVQAGHWTFARYMRAPLASTGLLAMVTLTALAGSNALYFQTAEHPSPFFMPAPTEVAALPTPAAQRPAAEALPMITTAPADIPAVTQETTGSVSAPVVVPDAPVGNAQMFAVQKKLFELNLFSGTIDGYYGPKTAEAIRAFEQRNGMTPTGSTDPAVMDAIIKSDSAGRVSQAAPVQSQPQAAQAASVAQPQPAPVQTASIAPQQDQVVAQLPALSPAEEVFDNVAQSAASTIDSIIAAVDTSRTPPQAMPNPPVPSANVAAAQAQPMPQPVRPEIVAPVQQAAATQPPASTSVRVPPANDTELVRQIQTGLASLGFFHAPIDGKPGTETARAIREFENFHRYRMTGQVQPDLVDLLIKAGATI